MITQSYLKQLFDYKDGILYRKISVSRDTKIGDIAGNFNSKGFWVITINYIQYKRSRLIFLFHKGYLPKIVDHEDRNPLNDVIDNLRDASHAQNMKNRRSAKNSSSQYLGVSKNKRGKFVAMIRINKINTYIGAFEKESLAALAYNNHAVKHHGEFANINIISS